MYVKWKLCYGKTRELVDFEKKKKTKNLWLGWIHAILNEAENKLILRLFFFVSVFTGVYDLGKRVCWDHIVGN